MSEAPAVGSLVVFVDAQGAKVKAAVLEVLDESHAIRARVFPGHISKAKSYELERVEHDEDVKQPGTWHRSVTGTS